MQSGLTPELYIYLHYIKLHYKSQQQSCKIRRFRKKKRTFPVDGADEPWYNQNKLLIRKEKKDELT